MVYIPYIPLKRRLPQRGVSFILFTVGLLSFCIDFGWTEPTFPWQRSHAFSIKYWTTRGPLGTKVDHQRLNHVVLLHLSSNQHDEEAWESEGDDEGMLDDTLAAMLEEDKTQEESSDSFDSLDTTRIDDSDSDESLLRWEWEQWSRALEKALSGLEKKRNSLQQEIVKAERLESLQRRAQLLQTYRYLFTSSDQATVQDWETGEDVVLVLDSTTYSSIGEEIDGLYAQSKKLKRGKQIVASLLDETTAAWNVLMNLKRDLEACLPSLEVGITPPIDIELFRLVQDRLVASSRHTNFLPPNDLVDGSETSSTKAVVSQKSKSASRKPTLGSPSSNIRKVTSPAGCTIFVGRNRRGNEYLSLTVARGTDVWMHARNTPGAHVLLVQRRGGVVATEACWQYAANLAAFYSDARSERQVSVSAAEPKHIQKPRGAPLGAVKLREELRVLCGHPDDVPEEFKEARATSGRSEEYRIQDKSKLRKQNKQQQQLAKEKAKRKAQAKKKPEEASNFF